MDRKKKYPTSLKPSPQTKPFSKISNEGIATHEHGVILDVNQAGAKIMGYAPREIMGKKLSLFLDKASARKAKIGLKKKNFKTIKINVIRKNGSTIPVEMTGSSLKAKGENLALLHFVDMSTHQITEEALKKSELSFRNLIEKSPDAIIIHTHTRTIYVNHAMLSLLGYSNVQELIGTPPMLILHPEDILVAHKRINRLKDHGDYNPPQEKRLIRKDGAVIFVDISSFLIYFEGVPMIVAVARDLTQRKKVEEALRRSEESFRNLIEKSPDGIVIHTLDAEPKPIYVNEAMIRFVGYSAQEIRSHKIGFFVHPKDQQKIYERISRLKSNKKYNPPQEIILIHKNGEEIHVEVVSFLIHYEGVEMVAVVVRDLTERKRAEEALIKFERLSTIGEMAAGMAHEIRNPLAAISTAAQILQRKGMVENKAPLETILEQSHRLEKLVKNTLDYSKPSRVPIKHSFSIKLALESALNLSQIQFGPAHKKMRIIWDLPSEDIQLNADSGHVQQILVNLILNAFQIMEGEGEVKLGVKLKGPFVFIRIEDNGKGITDSNIKRIFEPFFTTKDNGSGLGLAISQRVAQENGGQIEVVRLEPRGTAFVLRMPIHEEGLS